MIMKVKAHAALGKNLGIDTAKLSQAQPSRRSMNLIGAKSESELAAAKSNIRPSLKLVLTCNLPLSAVRCPALTTVKTAQAHTSHIATDPLTDSAARNP